MKGSDHFVANWQHIIRNYCTRVLYLSSRKKFGATILPIFLRLLYWWVSHNNIFPFFMKQMWGVGGGEKNIYIFSLGCNIFKFACVYLCRSYRSSSKPEAETT